MNALTPTHILPRLKEVERHFVAHAVTDNRDAPIVIAGDYVVADTTDTEPAPGAMFLVEWSNGRRDMMSTRPAACERRFENGRSHLLMRKDGSHTVWWFDCIANSKFRMCDGPYELDHMRSKIVGRIVGVVEGEAAIQWAEQQIGEYDRSIDQEAQKIAKSFDPDLWIDLRDRTGQVSALLARPGGNSVLAVMVEHDSDEADRIYKEHRSTFDAQHNGLVHSRVKLEAALRKAGRVMTLKGGHWHADPRMPAHVRAVHCPAIEGEAA